MDSATQEIYFQKLQELIEDEDKIVTVFSFAKEFQISVQESTNILKQYLEDNRKLKPNSYAATYVVTGTLKNSEAQTVRLVKDCDLKLNREEFQEIVSETLYSIQKSKDVDYNIVALVDWPNSSVPEEQQQTLLGTVISKNYIRRKLQAKILPPPPTPTVKGKSSFFAPKTEAKSSTNGVKDSKTKSSPISNLFNKVSEKEPEKKVPEKKTAAPNKTSKGSLTAFFSKQSQSSSSESIKNNVSKKDNEKEKTEIKESAKSSNGDLDDVVECLTDIDLGSDMEVLEDTDSIKRKKSEDSSPKKSKDSSPVAKKKKTESRKSVKRLRKNSDEKSNKRRKRIIEQDDSGSDDMFANDENDENMVEKSDDEKPRSPSPAPVKVLAPKNKKRVAVDRSYMDEEGFMVTKREYVYETASEDEEPQPKIEKKKSIEKTKSTSSETESRPKGTKGKKNAMQNQPTLMNFFKKK